jgi:hypothetical protein
MSPIGSMRRREAAILSTSRWRCAWCFRWRALPPSRMSGQFNNPVRVVAFNTSEGWSRDVSEDVAREVVRRVAGSGRPLAASSRQFVEAYVDEDELLRAESGVA